MKSIILISSISFLVAGCRATKIVSFIVADQQGLKFHYQMKIPKGYTMKEMGFENEKTKMFIYQDSSRLFFSDNIKQSAFYPDAYKKYGSDLNLKFLSSDTITISGIDVEGKLWEERKVRHVVYGYMKVPLEKKEMFDITLNGFISK